MIKYINGNILKVSADALVNPVNCVGVMGRGLALTFKQNFPIMFKEYQGVCKDKELDFGKLHVFEIQHSMLDSLNKIFGDINFVWKPRYIINFPTKYHWKDSSKIENIRKGLVVLKEKILELDIKSIALPALGCGLGGLSKKEVFSAIEEVFVDYDGIVIIFDNKF
jgi:O-acetyl-ADP-ribose deacetylase (regulator of RNase III)